MEVKERSLHLIYLILAPVPLCLATKEGKATSPARIGFLRIGLWACWWQAGRSTRASLVLIVSVPYRILQYPGSGNEC